MSRTIRCQSGYQFWRNPSYRYWSWKDQDPSWKYNEDTHARYWESDNPCRYGYKHSVKTEDHYRRRNDERHGLSAIFRGEADDFFDIEKAYKGIIWNYD